MNEHVIVNQAKFFPSNYTNQVVHLFTALSRSIVNIQIYIFGHVLAVNSRCYGCCYVNKLIPLCTFLNFHTHLEVNSTRSFQKFFKCSRALNLVSFKKIDLVCTTASCDLKKKMNLDKHITIQ